MQLLIPMAGVGKRFSDAGYAVPKPLLPVAGEPMFVQATRSFPDPSKIIFVVNPELESKHAITKRVHSKFPSAIVLVEPAGHRQGQATTCAFAQGELDLGEGLAIGPCDSGMEYSVKDFRKACSSFDALIFTYRSPHVADNPKMYGYVKTAPDGKATAVSCKVPISDNPGGDPVVIGAFWFCKASDFLASVSDLVAANDRTNNEFYVDVAMNYAIRRGLKVGAFDITPVPWGIPAEYEAAKSRAITLRP